MSTTLVPPADSLAELLHRLGDVPPERVLATPAPGTATPADVLRLLHREPKRLCELVDGVLVEKAMGHQESRIAAWLLRMIGNFLDEHPLGILAGADGPHKLWRNLVRYPDVAFIAWSRIPEDADPEEPMPDWIPNLAVEILSAGNTASEMARKLEEYFKAGVELVWYVYPPQRIVKVYTSPSECRTLSEGDELDGGHVLPGFRLAVRDLISSGQLRRPTA